MKSSVGRTLGFTAVLVMLTASTLQPVALARELEGATLADTVKTGEKTLKLNGLGLRKKAMFKVYVGGLYLESPSKDANAILAFDQAKAIRLYFLHDLTKQHAGVHLPAAKRHDAASRGQGSGCLRR